MGDKTRILLDEDLPDVAYEQGPSVIMEPGGFLVLLTDGVLEAESPDGSFFDEAGLLEVMRRQEGRSAQEIVDSLMLAVEKFHGGMRQDDDVTAVVIRIES